MSSNESYTGLVPNLGAWVLHVVTQERGAVVDRRLRATPPQVLVRWWSGRTDWTDVRQLSAGFVLGMAVQEAPSGGAQPPLGEGVVLDIRHLGQRDQVLVEFPETGDRLWLPFENLRAIRDCRQRFVLGQVGEAENAEKFRLRCLAHALASWNENTGALSQLEIDPLPHQIFLVHHILASGNLNWLIADDVGLGKTIEVGMLLSALIQRGQCRRILIVSPAGLVRQWQEEMLYKFGLGDFEIYGEDFSIRSPRQWRGHDHVIGSMDRLKADDHLNLLLQADTWDVIVFDEAHRLSRRQWGERFDAAQRFKLAAALRRHTPSILLLSGTPHQGMADKFKALLELLRPELREQIERIELHPEILRRTVIRNHKADVTDAEGNFVFKAKLTRAVTVRLGPEGQRFERALRLYLKHGYQAGKRLGQQGVAIGFVMTTYRKLAASSLYAIHQSLLRRRDRLLGELEVAPTQKIPLPRDERFAGESEEQIELQAQPFFSGEIDLLEKLINEAARLLADDTKLVAFMDGLVGKLLATSPTQKLLVFTEYRGTQEYVASALRSRYGQSSVALIHGGMTFDERALAISRFEADAQFLVSTEAGGEGLNLHRECHIMANYDLPWNPMRLVQRVGRLFRYGQKENVLVFNLHSPDTLDGKILDLLYDRISTVVQDLAPLGVEFTAALHDEILGELAELIDVEAILAEADTVGVDRTRERIEEALARAREALETQHELFKHATAFDPSETRGELPVDTGHLQAFVLGMCSHLGIEIIEQTHNQRVFELRLPEGLLTELPGSRRRLRISFDRSFRGRNTDIEVMDLGSSLLRYLLDRARTYAFKGIAAGVGGLPYRAVFTGMLRWQSDRGRRLRQEYTVVGVAESGTIHINPENFASWLLEEACPASNVADLVGEREEAERLLGSYRQVADDRLGQVSNEELHPENRQLLAAAWCGECDRRPLTNREEEGDANFSA